MASVDSPLSLRANFSWTFVGNIVYAISQWGVLVVLAKLGTPTMVGQFALGLAVTAPVIMFSNLQLRGLLATDARRQFYFGDYFGLRLLMTSLAMVVIIGIAVVTGYRLETAVVVVLVGVMKAFDAISDVFYGLLQQYERMDRIAKSMMVKGVLSLLFLSAGVYLTRSVAVGAALMAAAMLARLVLYDLPSGRLALAANSGTEGVISGSIRPRFAMDTMKQLFVLALPLGLVMMLLSLNTNIPRYLLERYLGEGELGIFASLAYLLSAGTMVISALGQSASPRLAQTYTGNRMPAFRRLVFQLLGIGALLGVTGILISVFLGKELLTLFYTSTYADSADVLVLVMIAAAIGYLSSFMGHAMTAARYLKIQLPLFVVVVASTSAASLYLIPELGMKGAGLALIAGAVVQFIGSAICTAHAMFTEPTTR